MATPGTSSGSKGDLLHLPILRFGKPYKSLDAVTVLHHRTREPLIRISQANIGLIRRDMMRQEEARAALAKLTVAELIAMSKRAAGHFLRNRIPTRRRLAAARGAAALRSDRRPGGAGAARRRGRRRPGG